MWAALITAALTLAASDYRVEPQPAWVEEAPLPSLESVPPDGQHVDVLVEDEQVNGIDQLVRYRRRAIVPRTPEAVGDVSQLQLRYYPDFQALRVHHVRRVRGGEVVDALATAEMRALQQENDLHDSLIHGEENLVIILSDVRAGDVIDYAWSVVGENPVVGDHMSEMVYVGGDRAAAFVRYRLHWPKERFLTYQGHEISLPPEMLDRGDHNLWVWTRAPAPAVLREDGLPRDFNPHPRVEISSWRSWEEVANWGRALYDLELENSPEAENLIRQWKALPNDRARVTAALELVQEQVRYLGMELGPHTVEPHAPADVLRRRFGDCKDKAMLLIALLRELDIQAIPVLVHSERGESLRAYLPSAWAFNHVVVQVQLDRTFLFDGTSTHKRGPLEERQAFNLGWGLPLTANTRDLVQLVQYTPAQPEAVVTERLWRDESGRARLSATTDFRGQWAQAQRRDIANNSAQDMARDAANFYGQLGLRVESLKPLEIEDDTQTNVIVVREEYRIEEGTDLPDSWGAWQVLHHLRRPQVVKRSQPLAVVHPIYVEHRIEVQDPRAPDAAPKAEDRLEGEALVFTHTTSSTGGVKQARFTLQTVRDRVQPEQLGEHLALMEKIQRAAGVEMGGLSLGAPSLTRLLLMNGLVGTVVLVALLWGPVQRYRKRPVAKRRRRSGKVVSLPGSAEAALVSSQQGAHNDGRTPESCIPVANMLAAVARAAAGEPHTCGGNLRLANDEPPARTAVGERELLQFTLTCSKCGKEQPQYFSLD